MCQNPPSLGQPAGWPGTGDKLKQNNNFSHSASA
jgi:hypothetical protein